MRKSCLFVVSTSIASPGFPPMYILSDKLRAGCDFPTSTRIVRRNNIVYLSAMRGSLVRYQLARSMRSSFALECKFTNDATHDRYVRSVRHNDREKRISRTRALNRTDIIRLYRALKPLWFNVLFLVCSRYGSFRERERERARRDSFDNLLVVDQRRRERCFGSPLHSAQDNVEDRRRFWSWHSRGCGELRFRRRSIVKFDAFRTIDRANESLSTNPVIVSINVHIKVHTERGGRSTWSTPRENVHVYETNFI